MSLFSRVLGYNQSRLRKLVLFLGDVTEQAVSYQFETEISISLLLWVIKSELTSLCNPEEEGRIEHPWEGTEFGKLPRKSDERKPDRPYEIGCPC